MRVSGILARDRAPLAGPAPDSSVPGLRIGSGRTALVVPGALCAFISALGLLPYVLYRRQFGSAEAFTSAFDEATYMLGELFAAYRLTGDAVMRLIDLVTPGLFAEFVVSDVLIPCGVVIAAWVLSGRLFAHDSVRVLSVLLLVFGQELLSLGNVIIWTGGELSALREAYPPLTQMVVPDSTTSYFSVFRTPEPGVSWILLFAFLAIIMRSPDPLSAFEGVRRRSSYPLLALVGFTYPFCSIPVVMIVAVLLGWALVFDRQRARRAGAGLAVAVASLGAAALIDQLTGPDVTLVFSSRIPVVTPAVLGGLLTAIGMVGVHRGAVIRRAKLLVPFTAAVLPAVLCNQQVLTGAMVSTRDWERYANYQLAIFAFLSLVAGITARSARSASTTQVRGLLQVATWAMVVLLALGLAGWQRDVYQAFLPSNRQAHRTATLLMDEGGSVVGLPVVLEEAQLTPLVRLLTADSHPFVLDYTRLFKDPVVTSTMGAATGRNSVHRDDLFEHQFRLGRSPSDLHDLLVAELESSSGFYSHLVFPLSDVWSPATDSRGLRIGDALAKVPALVAAYSAYVHERVAELPRPALLVISGQPTDPGDGRTHALVGTAPVATEDESPLHLYLQAFPPSDS